MEVGLDTADVADPIASHVGTSNAGMRGKLLRLSDHITVMLPSCQDKMLVCTYQNLPHLSYVLGSHHLLFFDFCLLVSRRLCEVKPFTGPVESVRMLFKPSCDNMSPSEVWYVFGYIPIAASCLFCIYL